MTAITDSFDRANSTTTLGNADTGETWLQENFSTGTGNLGIISNQAYRPAGTGQHLYGTVDMGTPNGQAEVTIVSNGFYNGVVGRYTNADNHYLVMNAINTGVDIWKQVAGIYTQIATTTPGISTSGALLGIVCRGSTINALVNGSVVLTVTDTSLTTGNRWGIDHYDGGTAPKFDNFQAKDFTMARQLVQLQAVSRSAVW